MNAGNIQMSAQHQQMRNQSMTQSQVLGQSGSPMSQINNMNQMLQMQQQQSMMQQQNSQVRAELIDFKLFC